METTWLRIGVALFLLVTFLYSILIANQLVVWFFLVLVVFLLQLALRLVRAVETIAENTTPGPDDVER